MDPYQKPLTISQSIWLVLLSIFITLVAFPVTFLEPLIGKSATFSVYYFVSMMAALLAVRAIFMKKGISVRHNVQIQARYVIPLAVAIFSIGIAIISPITSLIPMPDYYASLFLDMVRTDIPNFIAVVLAAPVLEELIFRGFILEGLLRKYSPVKSIMVSSFLFGFMHLNPWQFISASIGGFFMGWIYYRTRNVGLTILVHLTMNLTAFVVYAIDKPTLESMQEPLVDFYGGVGPFALITMSAIIAGTACIWYLNTRMPVRHTDIVDHFVNEHASETNAVGQDDGSSHDGSTKFIQGEK